MLLPRHRRCFADPSSATQQALRWSPNRQGVSCRGYAAYSRSTVDRGRNAVQAGRRASCIAKRSRPTSLREFGQDRPHQSRAVHRETGTFALGWARIGACGATRPNSGAKMSTRDDADIYPHRSEVAHGSNRAAGAADARSTESALPEFDFISHATRSLRSNINGQ